MFPEIVFSDGSALSFFNLLAGAGIILAFLNIRKTSAKLKIPPQKEFHLNLILALSLVSALAGSRVFDAWVRQLPLLQAGYTFLGGFLAGLFTAVVLCLIFRFKFLFLLNLIAPALALGHAFGRIGCFFAGCCHGHPTDSFLGVLFPKGSPADHAFGMIPVHATQLYESAGLFLMFLGLKKMAFEKRISGYLLAYGILRFLLEFLRGDSRGEISGFAFFSPSQAISLCMILAGLILFFAGKKNLIKNETDF